MVNLLPWREQKRQRDRRRFLAAAACCLSASLALLLLLYRALEADLAAREIEIAGLRGEIARLAAAGAEADRLAGEQGQIVLHMQVLQDLQRGRSLAAEIFAALSQALPEEAMYREVERDGNELRLAGEAESHAALAALMRNLAASPLFAEVELLSAAKAVPMSATAKAAPTSAAAEAEFEPASAAAEAGPAGAAGAGRLAFSLLLRLIASGS